MAITRIKTNQITDENVTTVKLAEKAVTSAKLADNLTYGSNLTVSGNLTVNGTSSTINSTTVTVDDPVLLLAPDATGSGALDLGFIGERGSDTNIAFVWDESADEFVAAFTSSSDSSTTVTVTDYADFHVGGLQVDDNANIDGTFDVTGATTLDSTLSVGGDVDMNSNTITNLADPSNAQDAATKAYVDSELSAGWTLSDGSNTQTIDVSASDTLTVSGTANEITTLVSATDTLTIGLPNDVTIGNDLTVTAAADIGTTLDVAGLASLDGGIDVDGAFTVADGNGNVATSGTLEAGATTLNSTLDVTGVSNFNNTTTSTTNTTGAVIIDGGLGLAENLNMGGNLDVDGTANVGSTLGVTGATTLSSTLDVTGNTNFNSTTGSTSTSTGAVVIDGGLGVAENAYVGGNIVVTGDLTVNGTTTTVNSTVTTVADPIMTIGENGSDDNKDRGIEFLYNDGSANVGFFGWDDSASGFTLLSDATNVSEVFSGTAGDLTIGGLTATTGDFSGAVDINGATTMADLTIDAASTISMGSNKVTNVADPTADQDAATKKYVDDTAAAASAFDIAGDTGTDTVTVGTDTLTFSGTANEIVTDVTDNEVTISLPDDVTIGDTLTVTGATTLSSTVDVTGLASLDGGIAVDSTNFTVSGSTGAVVTASTLDVAGLASLDGGIDVDGAFTVADTSGNVATTGTLEVTGATASLDAAVTINESGNDVDFRVEGSTNANMLVVDAGTDTVNIGTATAVTDASLNIGTTDSFIMPKGTTAERPAVGVTAMMRWSTTNGVFEYYDGSQWKNVTADFTTIVADAFNGDGSTVAFTITNSATTAQVIVSINGVVQVPTTAYGVSGTTLTFTEAPATGDVIDVRIVTTTSTVTGIDDGGGNAAIDANADGNVYVTGALAFNDSDASNYVAFEAPSTVSSDITWVLPGADGSNGQALVTNGSGTLSWAAAGATISQDNSTNTAFNLYYAAGTSGALTAVKYDGGTLTFNPSTETLACTNFSGIASSAQYADLAEIYTADAEIEPGTVVCFGGDAEVTVCDHDMDRKVAGVVSTNPAYLMNSDADGVAVALQGRVPCKVTGAVSKGDMMVSAGNGMARAEENPAMGSVIGKALQDHDGGEGVIEVAIGRL